MDDETIKQKAQERIIQLDTLTTMDNPITSMSFMQRAFAKEREEMKDIIDDKNMEEDIDKDGIMVEMNDVMNSDHDEEGEIEMEEDDDDEITIKTKKNTNPILKPSGEHIIPEHKTLMKSRLAQLVNEVVNNKPEENNDNDESEDEMSEDENENDNTKNESNNINEKNDTYLLLDDQNDSSDMEIIEEKENKEKEVTEVQLSKNENQNEILQIQTEQKMEEDENQFKEDQKEILRMAFADDDVLNEIQEINEDQRKKKEEESAQMAGWGSWTGIGIEQERKKKEESKPKSTKRKQVILNTDYDKKYAKYTLDELPKEWTYPLIQPQLIKEAERRGFL